RGRRLRARQRDLRQLGRARAGRRDAQKGDLMHIHLCTTIGAPVDGVWATVEDISTHTEWMADAESIEFVTEQRRGVGTEFDCRTRVGPLTTVDRMRVTEWEPGSVMGIEHRGVVTGTGRFTLRATSADLTEFCW